jgi:2-polyprenyl-3-methyl-5-hydroxy-6-metoxy-1,4-benzoquinol methylase
MIRPIVTTSDEWLKRHRDTHAVHAGFGTHRHPYLLEQIQAIVKRLSGAEKPSLLDYGCGKGVFLQAMKLTGWFRFVRGYDPAVDAFKARPAQQYDVVICLDVLDQLEEPFIGPLIEDVAQFTRCVALFDVITVQTEARAHLNPRSAAAWQELIGSRLRLQQTLVRQTPEEELRQGACPERAILIGSP